MKSIKQREPRLQIKKSGKWDYFSSLSEPKLAFIENISEHGCLLKTTERIDLRRWIRLLIKDVKDNITLNVTGRIVYCQEQMEIWDDINITLYRCGIEFIRPINMVLIEEEITEEIFLTEVRESCQSLLLNNLSDNLGTSA